jgi:hypothetical protein
MIFNLISCTQDQDLNDSTYEKPSEKEKQEEKPVNNINNTFFVDGRNHSIRYPYFGRNSYDNNIVLRYTSHDVSHRANRGGNGQISQLNISFKKKKLSTSLTMEDIKSLHFIVPNGNQTKTIVKTPTEGVFSFKLEDRKVDGIADYYILDFYIGKRGEKEYIKGHYEGPITNKNNNYIDD